MNLYIPLTVRILDGKGIFTGDNLCFFTVLGYKPQEIEDSFQNDFFRMVYDRGSSLSPAGLQLLAASDGKIERILDFADRNGRKVPFLLCGYVVDTIGQGKVLYAFLFDKDVYEGMRERGPIDSRGLYTFISNLPGGLFAADLENGHALKYISEGMLSIIGCTKEQFEDKYGNDIRRLIYSEDRKRCVSDLNNDTMENQRFECRIVSFDGTVKWVLCNRQAVRGVNGKLYIYVTVFDVTQIHDTRDALEKTYVSMNHLLNSIPGGVAQYEVSPKSGEIRLIYASEGFYRLLATSKEEYTIRKKEDANYFVCSEDKNAVLTSMKAQSLKGNTLRGQFCLKRRDGAAVWISVDGNKTVSSDGTENYYCVFLDITDLKKTEEALEYEKKRYQLFLSCTDNITYEYDYCSDTLTTVDRNRKSEEGITRVIRGYRKGLKENDSIFEEDKKLLMPMFEGSTTDIGEIRLKTPDSRERYQWHEMKGKVIRNDKGVPVTAIGVVHNIDEIKRKTDKLKYKSERDLLTNLLNKVSANANVIDYITNEGRSSVHAMMIVDLDNFKEINDSYGHQFGDAVLVGIGQNLSKLFRSTDIVGRIGGDEFLVFMKDVVDESIIREKADLLCHIFNTQEFASIIKLSISSSIGISMYPDDGVEFDELYQKADNALYAAKMQGKNCYRFYDNGLEEQRYFTQRGEGQKLSGNKNYAVIRECIRIFCDTSNAVEAVNRVLGLVGQNYSLSRVYVFENSQDNLYCSNTFEWCAEGIESQRDNLQNFAYEDVDDYPHYFDPVNHILYFNDIEYIKTYSASLYGLLAPQNIKAMLQVAIIEEGAFRGFIGFDYCDEPRLWTNEEIDVLTALASMIEMRLRLQ